MTEGVKTIIFPVKDVARAKAVFGTLLGEPMMDTPYYIGYRVAGQDIGLDPNGHAQGLTGPVAYWHVTDIKARIQALEDAGATTLQDLKDVGRGRLVASVTDADGNPIGLIEDPA